MRDQMAKEKLDLPLPRDGLVYDYVLDDGGIFNVQDDDNKDDDEANKKQKVVRLGGI